VNVPIEITSDEELLAIISKANASALIEAEPFEAVEAVTDVTDTTSASDETGAAPTVRNGCQKATASVSRDRGRSLLYRALEGPLPRAARRRGNREPSDGKHCHAVAGTKVDDAVHGAVMVCIDCLNGEAEKVACCRKRHSAAPGVDRRVNIIKCWRQARTIARHLRHQKCHHQALI
jgi:hypothetical protein